LFAVTVLHGLSWSASEAGLKLIRS